MTIQLKSKKSTLLDCLNDILRYFQDRLRSKDIRTFKSKYIHGVVKSVTDSENGDESTIGTLSRKLKKIGSHRPDLISGRPNKWQAELARVSRTVDEYLKMAMPSEMRSNSGSDITESRNQRTHARQVSGFSTDTSMNNVSLNPRHRKEAFQNFSLSQIV